MYKSAMLLFIIYLFLGCNDENPVSTNQIHTYEKQDMYNSNPFLIFDDEGNAMTFYGQDTLSMSGYHNIDGEFDLLMLKKFNKNGESILDETNVIKTNAILDYAIIKKDNQYFVVWLDPKNNPDFRANYLHTYYVDIYYKIIDDQGIIIQDDTRLTKELMDYQDASSNYILSGIYEGTIDSIKINERDWIEGIGFSITDTTSPNFTWIIFDSYNMEYHFKTYGNHITGSSKLSFTKIGQDSSIIVEETIIGYFKKLEGAQWGPDILNLFIQYDGSYNIGLCWQLNDGFDYYYTLLNTQTNDFIMKQIGTKYPTLLN